MHNLLCDKSSSQFPFSALSLAAFLPEPARITNDVCYLPETYAQQKAKRQTRHVWRYHDSLHESIQRASRCP